MSNAPFTINPFEFPVVHEPKRCGRSVETLNGAILDSILQRLELLARTPSGSRPRFRARLVLAPSPGYGKSHLIGRLYQQVSGQSVVIHQPPFQAATLPWQSILANTVRELCSPTSAWNAAASAAAERWQIDVLANQVLGRFVHDLIESRVLALKLTPAFAAALSRLDLAEPNEPVSDAIRSIFVQQLLVLSSQVKDPGVADDVRTWLLIFYHLASSRHRDEVFRSSLAWLRYEPIDLEQAELLGLKPHQCPQTDDPGRINEGCWRRLRELCNWATPFRPFLLCFDQTEDYASRPELAVAFGSVVRRIIDELSNQLTIVTANQNVWQSGIWQHLDSAAQARFDLPPAELRGVTRQQAGEFIRVKLADAGIDQSVSTTFADSFWIDQLFQGTREIPAREFMARCRERWDGVRPAREELTALFERMLLELSTSPRRLEYDPDLFRWIVAVPLGEPDEITVELAKDLPPGMDGILELRWCIEGRGQVLFGFFRELQPSQWKSLAAAAQAMLTVAEPLAKKVLVFRTAEQPAIPKPGWVKTGPAIQEGLNTAIHLVVLRMEETAELYAGRKLYLDMISGDLAGYTEADVLGFLSHRFRRWRQLILEEMNASK